MLHIYIYKSWIKDATNWSKGCVEIFVKGHFTALQNAWNVDTTLPQHSSVFTEITGQSNLSFITDTRKLLHLKSCSHVAHLHWNCLSTSHHLLYLCHLLTGKMFFGERRWGNIETKEPHDRNYRIFCAHSCMKNVWCSQGDSEKDRANWMQGQMSLSHACLPLQPAFENVRSTWSIICSEEE